MGILIAAASLAGCAGGTAQNSNSSLLPAVASTAKPRAMSVLSTGPNNAIAVTGTIIAKVSGGFQVEGGGVLGYYDIFTTSKTIYANNFSPAIGDFVAASGTGTPSTSMTAASVSLQSPASAPLTLTGQVSALVTGGFTIRANGVSTAVYPVWSTVYSGPKPVTIGEYVAVKGLGAAGCCVVASSISQTTAAAVTPLPSASPTVKPSSTPAPINTMTPAPIASATPGPTPSGTSTASAHIATTHVLVAGYIYGYAGTPTTVPISSIAPYVNWGYTSANYVSTLRANGINVIAYKNFWRNYTSDNPKTGYADLAPGGAHAAAAAKDCSGNAIVDPTYGGGYVTDPRTPAALGHAQVVLTNWNSTGGANAVFTDDTGTVIGIPMPCGYTQSAWFAGINAVNQGLNTPMFVNALGGMSNPASGAVLVEPSDVLGAMCEVCYGGNSSQGDVIQTGTTWQNIENAEIAVVARHKIFWDYARFTGDPAIETNMRMYAYASLLLSYDPAYAMMQEAFHTASGFPVMPETGFVPVRPLTTAASVDGYRLSGGAYMREFAACYYRGNLVNKCAIVINPGTSSAILPATSYAHSVVLSGSGVLDGGTVTFSGSKITQLGPGSAAILLP